MTPTLPSLMPKSVIRVIMGTRLSSNKECAYYITSESKSVFINHFHYIAHLRAEFLCGITINHGDFNILFTIHNRNLVAGLLTAIGIRDPIHYGSSKAEKDIGPSLKRRGGKVGRQVAEAVDRSNVCDPA